MRHRAGAGRGALDLRGAAGVRPPARAHETDPVTRRALISERVEGSFATVFRQTVLTRYEQRAYAMRAEGGSAHRRPALGRSGSRRTPSTTATASGCPTATGWAGPTSPTSSDTRFYTYAYVFAHLVAARALRALPRGGRRVRRGLPRLPVGRRLERRPAELLRTLGVDLEDPAVWERRVRRDGADGGGCRGG